MLGLATLRLRLRDEGAAGHPMEASRFREVVTGTITLARIII